MIGGLIKAFEQLNDPPIRRVIWRSLLIALGVLVGLVLLIGFGFSQIELAGWPWLDTIIGLLGGAGAAVLAVLFFPATLGLVASEFLDDVAKAVERRHYPLLPPARTQPFGETLGVALKFTSVKLVLNLIAFVLVSWIPLVNIVVFFLLNGYLIGREFFEMVGLRRLAPGPLKALRRAYRGRLIAAGVVIAALSTVPILNLLMPIIGAATMVHVFQSVRTKSSV